MRLIHLALALAGGLVMTTADTSFAQTTGGTGGGTGTQGVPQPGDTRQGGNQGGPGGDRDTNTNRTTGGDTDSMGTTGSSTERTRSKKRRKSDTRDRTRPDTGTPIDDTNRP
jgi:hypothetical protein